MLQRRAFLCFALLTSTASCVHGNRASVAKLTPPVPDASAALAGIADPFDTQTLSSEQALAANAALPVTAAGDSGAAPFFARGATALDQMRSLECLAQAVFYEARSETEDGQRAVAQVVINRMRHPAYPASICGVVYQGPMRAGGGCQFTFTCDGSLATPPNGPAWIRARAIAAQALAGSVYAPVGHATHYHTTAVFPHWAPRLLKAGLIGSHIFYRFPGTPGTAAAFTRIYAGREPLPVPSKVLFPKSAPLRMAAVEAMAAKAAHPVSLPMILPLDNLPQAVTTDNGLPQSRVRDAYANSGRLRDLSGSGSAVEKAESY